MLEVKNLTRIYNTKGAGYVLAIDNISLTFGERGMVFLLGKSGSGKSTLLNLIGGLDRPDSGEIIIKGRRSSAFTAGDFDSYRNTYVGFIFQEYNVLDEFTVEDNIALALELQGKSKDRAKIDEILRLVELEDYGKRKPNTLSGGQKQRVAIARALVKEPQIIMADEPTGALDSETGRQVLETLKKLSQSKLVIVVSHDREFAENYADRIIELKDGKVISDLTRIPSEPENERSNVFFAEDNTIKIVAGSELKADDLEKIRQFVRGAAEGVRIDAISAAKSPERFEKTDNEKYAGREYSLEESALIRSRLPMRHAIKIGASGMVIKPVRLAFTILLTFIAFTMFGLFSTLMLFSEQQIMVSSLAQSGLPYVLAEKHYNYTAIYEGYPEDYARAMTGEALFKEEEAERIWQDTDPQALFAINGEEWSISNLSVNYSERYSNVVKAFAVSSPQSVFRTPQKILWGGYPEGDDEIMISSYLFDCIKYGSLSGEAGGAQAEITEYSQLEGVKLRFDHNYGSAELTVCGVFDCGEIPQNSMLSGIGGIFGGIFGTGNTGFVNSSEYSEGLFPVCFVSDGFYEANEWLIYPEYFSNIYSSFVYTDNVALLADGEEFAPIEAARYNDPYLGRDRRLSYGLNGELISSLADGEVVVPDRLFARVVSNRLRALSEGEEAENYSAAVQAWAQPDESGLSPEVKNELFARGSYQTESGILYADRAQRLEYYGDIVAFLESYSIDPFDIEMRAEGSESRVYNLNVAGCYITAEYSQGYGEDIYGIYCGDGAFMGATDGNRSGYSTESNYSREGERYTCVYLTNESGIVNAISQRVFGSPEADSSFYTFSNIVCLLISSFTEIAAILSGVFLWVGIILTVFSMLLLFNVITVSVLNKKREIGILRALGARSADVFKIFFAESGIITLICLALSVCCSLMLCALFNGMLSAEIGIPFTMFVFGPLSFLLVIAVAVFSSFIATILPVYSIAKKRPVESIRAL